MHPRLTLLLGSLSLVLAQSPDGPVINTPASVPQCLPSLLQFHGGTPPYTISAIPGGQPGAPPIAELGQQSGDSFTWIANLPANTSVTLQIRDSKGNINYSQMFTVQASSDSSCLKSGANPTSTTPPPTTASPSPPTTGAPSVSTGTTAASSSAKPGNTTSTAPAVSTNVSATTSNATAAIPNANASNPNRGSSPFVSPNTTPVNNANANPAASAASSVSTASHLALLAGLVFAASSVFA